MATATAANAKSSGLRIRRLEMENWLRLKGCTICPEGEHVRISGPNGSGKTAILDAIWAAIKGVSVRQFPEPINAGEDAALLRLDLGEVVIERKITAKGAGLNVTRRDGTRVPRPQQFLDSLFSAICLDPGQFLGRRPQDQVDDVLAVCGVKPPVESVLAIVGSEADGLADGSKPGLEPKPGESAAAYLERLSADETGLIYLRRREAHRDATQKAAALEEQRRRFQELGGPPGPGEGEESVAELARQLEELNRKEDERRAVAQQAAESSRELEAAAAKVRKMEGDRDNFRGQADRLAAQIEHLQRQREDLVNNAALIDDRIARANASGGIMRELQDQATADFQALAALPDRSAERAEVRHRMGEAERANKSLIERQLWARQIDGTARAAEEARAAHERLDGMLARLRELRRNLLAGVDLGIDGLELGDGELRLGGVPLLQASRAQQMEVALALAMRGDPELRLVRLDDAEHLDAAARRRVLERAAERGFQVFMTCVADDGPLRVEILEGEAD